MADKFLNTGGGGSINLSNGTADIYSSTLGVNSLDPSKPIKTNSVKQLISTNLEISDTNNLQAQLDLTITNPLNQDLNMNTNQINNLGDPILTQDATTKIYVDTTNTQSTGLISGGLLSYGTGGQNVATTFSIASGTGTIVSDDPLTDNSLRVENISWNAETDVAITNLATQDLTYIVRSNSGIVQLSVNPSNVLTRQYIIIGVIVHQSRTTVQNISTSPSYNSKPFNHLYDLTRAIGKLNTEGNTLLPNADLTFQKSAGKIYAINQNYAVNPQDPSITSLSSYDSTTTPFTYIFQDGTNITPSNNIDPNLLDDGTAPGIGFAGNLFGVQRVFTNTVGSIFIQPAQFTYGSLSSALDGVNTEIFLVSTEMTNNGILIGFIACQGTTSNLQTTNDALVFNQTKFGAQAVSSAVSTLQSSYNNSSVPEILTDPTHKALSIQVGSALDTDNVLECKNIAGTKTFEVDGVGDIKCNNITTVSDKVHIGLNSGITTQGVNSVAIGVNSGNNNQGSNSVSIGNSSGQISQGDYSVAIGLFSGQNSLANGTVAIGSDSARNNSGLNSLYLGGRAGVNAGGFSNVVVLSGKDTACDPTQASQFMVCSGVNTLTHDSNGLTTNNVLDSTSATTGSIHTSGGIGCALDLFVGGDIIGVSLTKASLNFGGDITSGSNYYNVNGIASNGTTSASIGPINMGIIPYTGNATLLTFNKSSSSICDVNIFYDTGTVSEVVRLPAGQWGTVVLAGNAVSSDSYITIKPHSTPVNHTGDCTFKLMIT